MRHATPFLLAAAFVLSACTMRVAYRQHYRPAYRPVPRVRVVVPRVRQKAPSAIRGRVAPSDVRALFRTGACPPGRDCVGGT